MGFGGYLQANTAVDVLIGPFIDDTDGKTAETALTLSQADIKLSKNGQALTQKNDDTAAAHDANGYYNCELNATDTNTEGTLTLIVHETGALPVRHDFMVLSQAAYTSLVTAKDAGYMDVNVKAISDDTTAPDNLELMYDGTGYAGGTTKLDVNVVTIAANAITATAINADAITNAKIADNAIAAENIAADAITAAKIANGAIDAATFAADADAEIAAMVWNAATASYGGAGTYGQAVEDTLADTNELQGDWANGGRLDLLLDGAASAGDPWSTALPGSYGAGTAGLLLGTTIPNAIDAIDNYVDTEIGALTTELAKVPKSDSNVSWNATALAAIQGECTDALNAYDPPTKAELDTAQGAVTVAAIGANVITAASMHADASAEIADAVWDEAIADHVGAGSTGKAATDILADTNELQVDDTPTAIAGVKTVVDLVEDILRNKMEITDANGNLVLYEDDGTTPKYSVNACVVDNSTTTTRKRLE